MQITVHGAPRGQTLVESAMFMPIMLLLLFAVIYFSNLGTVYQRAQITARYGGLIGFGGTNGGTYSAAAIYTTADTSSGSCAAPPQSLMVNASPFPGPTSAPYWGPDWTKTSSSCAAATQQLVGAKFLASRYMTAGNVSVQAQSVMPVPLVNFLPGFTADVVSAGQAWVHPAWPSMILACTNKTAAVEQEALTAIGTSPVTTILPASGWPATCPNL